MSDRTPQTRKRLRNTELWKRSKQKKSKYSAGQLPLYPKCGHQRQAYQCKKLTMQDVYAFHKAFYAKPSKLQQDNLILKYCNAKRVQRKRPVTGNRVPKKLSFKYSVRSSNGDLIPVCKGAFLKILNVGKNRVQGILTRHFASGQSASENGGGDRHSTRFKNKKHHVLNFINRFQPRESHYCRGKTNRQYLDSDLNISRIWKMYQTNTRDSPDLQVKLSYFRHQFNTNFNYGFGSPRTDVCSTCLELKERIKVEKNLEEQSKLQIELRVHKLRSQAFYSFLKHEPEGVKILSFDCQKNQPMPKLPDQATYYSRQLYLYNFTVVVGGSKSPLRRDNVHSFVWTEDMYMKGSNEVSSALFHLLCSLDLKNIHTVRLIADGCGGQNKNTILIGMLNKWLSVDSPKNIETVEIIFPVSGHSFPPADRVFALIERRIKKKEVIVDPQEYIDIIEEFATVYHFGKDVVPLNWKSSSQEVIKPPGQWHFQFKSAKRFILKRGKGFVSVRGEQFYKSDYGISKNICKKGKALSFINPTPILHTNPPKYKKLKDVNVLLTKQYGIFWKNIDILSYYKRVIETCVESAGAAHEDQDPEEEEEEPCTPQEEVPTLIV